jgi:Fe-Mn family superoxide dismutase
LAEAMARDFGSVDRWRQEFIALAQGMAGGSGWVILSWVPRDGALINQIGFDHTQSVAGGMPILAIDMYEHAYHLDFGTNAQAYIATFMRNIDWNAVLGASRTRSAASPRPLEQKELPRCPPSHRRRCAPADAGEEVQVIDARPRALHHQSHEIMGGRVA